jgi:protein-tyrosine phosphatase
MEGTLNMRDLGGFRTNDGRYIKMDRLFRSANLAHITSNDTQTLSRLGIKTVVDLRGPKEALDHPDQVPTGTAIIPSRIIGSETGDAIDNKTIRALFLDANLPETMLDVARVTQHGPYYRMLFLVNIYGTESHTSRLTKYRPLFRALFDLGPDEAMLVHCTGGRDRTGVGVALLLKALGVSQQDIEADFVASNQALQPDREDPNSTAFLRFMSANVFLQPPANKYYQQVAKELGASPESIRNAVKLRPNLLGRMFASIDTQYGSFSLFLRSQLGVGPDELETLRRTFLA